ncbi:MAG: hypothetical protein AAFM92_12910 [Pseudomonadota bacterium]
MKRLILHAGMHKTGTTAIQSIAAKNRDDLFKKGVYYPRSWEFFGNPSHLPSANAHFSLFNALAGLRPRDKKNLQRFRTHLLEEIPDDFTILLSAESLNRHVVPQAASFAEGHRAYIARVAEYFAGFHTEAVVYFRQPSDFAESMYAENAVSYPVIEGFKKAQKSFVKRFQYRELREGYAVHFPISCRSFEAEKDRLPGSFWRDSGLPAPSDILERTRRPSIPKAAVRWIYRAKRHRGAPMERPERLRRWLFAYQDENAQLFRSSVASSFWDGLSDSAAFHDQMLDGFGDIAFARPASVPPRCAWSAQDHAQAEARFAAWQTERADWLRERAERGVPPFIDPEAP